MTPGPSTRGPALPCLAIALVLLALLGAVRASAELPVIDLSDVTSLDGRWAFRFGDDPSWAAVDAPDQDWERLEVPGTWGRQGHRGRSGFAWYRHRVELRGEALAEARAGRLALRFRNVDSAYALYLGGEHVWTNGAFPPEPKYAYDRHAVVPIPAAAVDRDASLTIALRVWKSPVKRATQGGIATGPVEIGRVDLLRTAFFYADLTYLALFILFALAGSYHLYLFWRRVALREYLWFGCVALLFATSVFGRTQMKYRVLDDFTIWKNIEYTAIYLAPVAFLEFVFALFSKPVPKVARALQVVCAGAALGTALTPIGFNISLLTAFEVAMLATLVGILWLVFREYRAGHPQAQTLGLAFLVLFVAVVNDMLRDQALMQTAQLMPLGFGLFTMQMAAGLADRFARTYRDLESLNAEMYEPSSVLTLIFSPISMNGGTRVLRPVSHVASLSWLVAVAPLIPGGVSSIVTSTDAGSSIVTGFSPWKSTRHWVLGAR